MARKIPHSICPRCKSEKPLTRHHVLPKRHYKSHKHSPIQILCRDCHDNLERLIPINRQTDNFYFEVVETFVKGAVT